MLPTEAQLDFLRRIDSRQSIGCVLIEYGNDAPHFVAVPAQDANPWDHDLLGAFLNVTANRQVGGIARWLEQLKEFGPAVIIAKKKDERAFELETLAAALIESVSDKTTYREVASEVSSIPTILFLNHPDLPPIAASCISRLGIISNPPAVPIPGVDTAEHAFDDAEEKLLAKSSDVWQTRLVEEIYTEQEFKALQTKPGYLDRLKIIREVNEKLCVPLSSDFFRHIPPSDRQGANPEPSENDGRRLIDAFAWVFIHSCKPMELWELKSRITTATQRYIEARDNGSTDSERQLHADLVIDLNVLSWAFSLYESLVAWESHESQNDSWRKRNSDAGKSSREP